MTALTRSRTGIASLWLLTLIGIAACGGGGSGSEPPAAPMLGPGASSISSADGKVTVSVGANALQAPAAVSVAPGTPDAATAADPSLVPGTTYTYTAPDIQVPEQVLISIESPAAAGASTGTAASGRKHALALPQGYEPPPTCLINGPLGAGAMAKNIWVSGSVCPASSAPACVKIFTQPAGTPTLCAPGEEIIFLTDQSIAQCPISYHEVTGDPDFADIAAANGSSRLCKRGVVAAPPVLGRSGTPSALGCTVKNGKFLCPAPKLPSGTYSVMWDREMPPKPTFDLSANVLQDHIIHVDEVGPPGEMVFRLLATDPHGLGGVELVEVIGHTPPAASGTGYSSLQIAQRWHADPALFTGAAVKDFVSENIVLPYTLADPANRRFFIRAYDRAGNSSRSSSTLIKERRTNSITIDSFTVTPATVPPPGGPVTIAWSVTWASAASIDGGVGDIAVAGNSLPSTGSKVVNVTAGTTFTLTATDPTRNPKTATASVVIGADTTAPSVAVSASPSSLVAPGSTTLTATASDMVGVTQVEFYRGATLIGIDTTAPYTQAVNFSSADIGSIGFTAKAYDAANNSTTSAVATVTVGADVTPPVVSLAASPSTVLLPGSTTLQATATDAIGVTQVEFWRGSTLIGTDTTAPYQLVVPFSAADIGNPSFTAKAFDAQGNNATSTPVIVTVSTPTTGDTYAGPNGIDTGNTTCAQATPCRSIAKAASLAQAGMTVWLQDGTYTPAGQPALISIPAGLTLRALTPGMAVLQRGLVLAGSATVVGVVLDRGPGNNFATSISASSGTITLEGIKFTGLLSSSSAPISASGTAQVTLSPGNVADYTDTLLGQDQAANVFAVLTGDAQLTINGGSFGGTGLGGGSPATFAQGFAAFQLQGSARLSINNASVSINTNGIYMNGAATQLTLNNTTLTAIAMQGTGRGINAAAGTPSITLAGSTISGFVYGANSAPIGVGNSAAAGPSATLSLTNSVLSGGSLGLSVQNGSTPTTATIVGNNLQVKNNYFGGLNCAAACSVDLAGGEVSGNGTTIASLASGYSFSGGLWFGATDKAYTVKLRNVAVVNNASLSTSSTNTNDNSGITLAGAAGSSYDLGTLASPGGNTFTGNTTGNQTTGINVKAAAGVTVNAVGNTFAAGVQGTDGQGKYLLGASPCGATTCNVTSGTGANYRVTSGALRLAQ